jgi:hypothetical protein
MPRNRVARLRENRFDGLLICQPLARFTGVGNLDQRLMIGEMPTDTHQITDHHLDIEG